MSSPPGPASVNSPCLSFPQVPLSPPVALAAVSFPLSNLGSIYDIPSPSSFRTNPPAFCFFSHVTLLAVNPVLASPCGTPHGPDPGPLGPGAGGLLQAGFPGTAAAGEPGAEWRGRGRDAGGRCGRPAGARKEPQTRRCRGPRSASVGTGYYFRRTPWRNCLP